MIKNNSRYMIGEKVPLKQVESAFRQHWRNVADSDQAVMKASTLNLILFVNDQKRIRDFLAMLTEVIQHHPGRVIIAANSDKEPDDFTADISACAQKSGDGRTQISAEFIALNAGASGSGRLAGAVLPFLLPDVPVYFWCEDFADLFHPDLTALLQYTDRLIIQTPDSFESLAALRKTTEDILKLQEECNISDLRWSELTDWREAVAQFFDTEQNVHILQNIKEINICYAGERLSMDAFLIAGWLSETLKALPGLKNPQDDIIFFHRSQRGTATITLKKIENAKIGLQSIKLLAEHENKSVIFMVKSHSDNTIHATTQIGSTLFPETIIRRTKQSRAQNLCDELDFVQQDEIYLKTLTAISGHLDEN